MVLAGEGLDCNRTLLSKVIRCSLGEGPLDECFGGDDFVGAWLVGVACGRDDRAGEIDLNEDVSSLRFKERLDFFLVDPDIAALLGLLDSWCASLQENALGCLVGARLTQVSKIDPSSAKDWLQVVQVLTFLGCSLLASFFLSWCLWLGQFHESQPASTVVLDSFLELDQLKALLLAHRDAHES